MAFVGQGRDNLAWRQVFVFRLADDFQNLLTLLGTEFVGRLRVLGRWAQISHMTQLLFLAGPAVIGSLSYPHLNAGWAEAGTALYSFID